MRNPNKVFYIDLLDDFFWSANCQGFAISNVLNTDKQYVWGQIPNENTTISEGQVYSIFDTGASSIILSNYYFDVVLLKIYAEIGDNQYEVRNGYVMTKCYNNFPTIFFMFQNTWFAVKAEDYVIDVSAA